MSAGACLHVLCVKYLRAWSRELGHSRQLHAATIQVKFQLLLYIYFFFLLSNLLQVIAMRKSIGQPDTHQGGIEAQSVTLCPAAKPEKLVPGLMSEQHSWGAILIWFFPLPFPLRRFFERFFSMSVLATHSK